MSLIMHQIRYDYYTKMIIFTSECTTFLTGKPLIYSSKLVIVGKK